MSLENCKGFERAKAQARLVEERRASLITPHVAPQRERVRCSPRNMSSKIRSKRTLHELVDRKIMDVPQLMMLLAPNIVWHHTKGYVPSLGKDVEASYFIQPEHHNYFEGFHKGGFLANAVYEGTYWDLMGDLDVLINNLRKLCNAPALLEEPILRQPGPPPLPKWEDFKPVHQPIPPMPTTTPLKLPPFKPPMLQTDIPFMEPALIPVPNVPSAPMEEPLPTYVAPTMSEPQPYEELDFVCTVPPPAHKPRPEPATFGDPKYGHDWSGNRPFQKADPPFKPPKSLCTTTWKNPPDHLPKPPKPPDVKIVEPALDLEPKPAFEIAWVGGPEPENAYSSPTSSSRPETPPLSRQDSEVAEEPAAEQEETEGQAETASRGTVAGTNVDLCVVATSEGTPAELSPESSAAPFQEERPPSPLLEPSDPPLTAPVMEYVDPSPPPEMSVALNELFQEKLPSQMNVEELHEQWEDVQDADAGSPALWVNFEAPYADPPPLFLIPEPEQGPMPELEEPMLEDLPEFVPPAEIPLPQFVEPTLTLPKWVYPSEPRPIGFLRGCGPVMILDVSGTMHPARQGRFNAMQKMVVELLDPQGEIATAAKSFDVITFCSAAWSWSAAYDGKQKMLASLDTMYSGRQVGGPMPGQLNKGQSSQATSPTGSQCSSPRQHKSRGSSPTCSSPRSPASGTVESDELVPSGLPFWLCRRIRLQSPEPELLEDARDWVQHWPGPVGQTNLMKALRMACHHQAADSWYIFSDGLVDDVSACFNFVKNPPEGIKVPPIHCVGMFAEGIKDHNGERFLRQLAALTGGSYQTYEAKTTLRVFNPETCDFREFEGTETQETREERLWIEACLRHERKRNIRLGIKEGLELTLMRVQSLHYNQKVVPKARENAEILATLRAEYENRCEQIRLQNDIAMQETITQHAIVVNRVRMHNDNLVSKAEVDHQQAVLKWQQSFEQRHAAWLLQKEQFEKDLSVIGVLRDGKLSYTGGKRAGSAKRASAPTKKASHPGQPSDSVTAADARGLEDGAVTGGSGSPTVLTRPGTPAESHSLLDPGITLSTSDVGRSSHSRVSEQETHMPGHEGKALSVELGHRSADVQGGPGSRRSSRMHAVHLEDSSLTSAPSAQSGSHSRRTSVVNEASRQHSRAGSGDGAHNVLMAHIAGASHGTHETHPHGRRRSEIRVSDVGHTASHDPRPQGRLSHASASHVPAHSDLEHVGSKEHLRVTADHSDLTQPEADHSDLIQPEADHSDLTQPEADHSSLTQPEADHSDLRQPVADHSDLRQPEADHSDLRQAEADHPDLAQSEADHSDLSQHAADHSGAHPSSVKDSGVSSTSIFGARRLQPKKFHAIEVSDVPPEKLPERVAEVVQEVKQDNEEKCGELKEQWTEALSALKTSSSTVKQLAEYEEKLDEYNKVVVETFAKTLTRSVLRNATIMASNWTLVQAARDQHAVECEQIHAENEELRRLHTAEVQERHRSEAEFHRAIEEWKAFQAAEQKRFEEGMELAKVEHQQVLEVKRKEWEQHCFEVKLNNERLQEQAEEDHALMVKEVEQRNAKHMEEFQALVEQKQQVEKENAWRMDMAKQAHQSRLEALQQENQEKMAAAQEQHRAVCARMQEDHELEHTAIMQEWEEVKALITRRNADLMADARAQLQQAMLDHKTNLEAACKAAQEQYTEALARVRKHNEIIWPKVRTAQIAQVELGRVMAFADHIRWCAHKMNIGINMAGGLPNLDRVVEMQALLEALQKAFPDKESNDYPWPGHENKCQPGVGWVTAPEPKVVKLEHEAIKEIQSILNGRQTQKASKMSVPSSRCSSRPASPGTARTAPPPLVLEHVERMRKGREGKNLTPTPIQPSTPTVQDRSSRPSSAPSGRFNKVGPRPVSAPNTNTRSRTQSRPPSALNRRPKSAMPKVAATVAFASGAQVCSPRGESSFSTSSSVSEESIPSSLSSGISQDFGQDKWRRSHAGTWSVSRAHVIHKPAREAVDPRDLKTNLNRHRPISASYTSRNYVKDMPRLVYPAVDVAWM